MSHQPVNGRAAVAYAERLELHVFPLLARSKEPHGLLCPRGYLNASNDKATILDWWSDAPEANIGVSAVASGLVIVDVDPRHDGDETLERLERELGRLPQTWTCLTGGGGLHIYFKDTGGAYLGTLGDGIEVKHKGYAIAPPSVHPSGKAYRWDAGQHPLETPLAELPAPWLARMTRRHGGAHRAPIGPAADSFLFVAFAHDAMIGEALPSGAVAVRCPWAATHSDGRGTGQDSSTVILPPTSPRRLGFFRCSHAHCQGRSLADVLAVLSKDAIDTASRVHSDAFARIVALLAEARS